MSPARTPVLIGIDLGTTSFKAIATDIDGVILGQAGETTPWIVEENGNVHAEIGAFVDAAVRVMAQAAERCPAPVEVLGIGITGMAETGVIVDASGTAVTPAMAWYDQRGAEEFAALPQEFRDEFQAVTGLAAKAECSFSKLLWLTTHGFTITPGMRWANALEYVAYALTGALFTEPSLASRTGLLDQAAVVPWSRTLSMIGADASFVPDMRPAGVPFGRAHEDAPGILRNAQVTVAGHDHLVGSVGAGAIGGDDLYDSCGTADVILRTLPRTLTNDERASLVASGLSAGRHVLPESTAILGATRSGLVLGRVLSMVGAHTHEERARISEAWTPEWKQNGTVVVSEPGNWTNEVTVQLRDDTRPEDVWCAAMDYVLAETRALVRPITAVAGEYTSAVAAGGWAHVPGVARGKAHIFPGLQVSEHLQPGARGACLFAAEAAGLSLAHPEFAHARTTHMKEFI